MKTVADRHRHLAFDNKHSDELLKNVNIDDFEWPWTPKIVFFSNFLLFWVARHILRVNLLIKLLLFYCMPYTDYQSGRTAAIARHVSFAQITCFFSEYVLDWTPSALSLMESPVVGPRTWNDLPEDVTSTESLSSLCQRLKTHLFTIFFVWICPGPYRYRSYSEWFLTVHVRRRRCSSTCSTWLVSVSQHRSSPTCRPLCTAHVCRWWTTYLADC